MYKGGFTCFYSLMHTHLFEFLCEWFFYFTTLDVIILNLLWHLKYNEHLSFCLWLEVVKDNFKGNHNGRILTSLITFLPFDIYPVSVTSLFSFLLVSGFFLVRLFLFKFGFTVLRLITSPWIVKYRDRSRPPDLISPWSPSSRS